VKVYPRWRSNDRSIRRAGCAVFVGDTPGSEVADAPRAAVDHSFPVQSKVCATNASVLPEQVAVVGLSRPPRAKS
jgi:hypothetical protein